MITTVSARAASEALLPSQYMHVKMAAPPAATGITGISMPRLLKAPASSVRAMAMAAPT